MPGWSTGFRLFRALGVNSFFYIPERHDRAVAIRTEPGPVGLQIVCAIEHYPTTFQKAHYQVPLIRDASPPVSLLPPYQRSLLSSHFGR